MRYLLLIIFVVSLASCQNPRIQTLEAENAGLVKLWEEEVQKSKEEAMNARQAEARAILALEDAKIAEARAFAAVAEAQRVTEKLKECEAGK